MQPTDPPPGWYPDPAGPGARYWDGGRWTKDTQAATPIGQGPAPGGPSAGGSLAPPNPQATPTGIGQPAPGPSGGQVGRPAGATATAPPNLAGFVDQLKRLQPVALAVVGFAVFLLSTVLPWLNVSGTGAQGAASGSFSAWSGEAPWPFRRFIVDFELREVANNRNPTGGTDMLLPLAIAAIVLLVVAARGKPVRYATEAAAAVGVVLVLLLSSRSCTSAVGTTTPNGRLPQRRPARRSVAHLASGCGSAWSPPR